jgi:hypothetical protein
MINLEINEFTMHFDSMAKGMKIFFLIMILIYLVIFLSLWLYFSFAYMAIAKKTNQNMPGLAWIPLIGPGLIASKAAKMHWWPIILSVGFFSYFIYLFLIYNPIIIILGYLSIIVYSIFFIIWMWKTFEAVGKPGWWVLLIFIPFVGSLIYLILLGIAAWSKN